MILRKIEFSYEMLGHENLCYFGSSMIIMNNTMKKLWQYSLSKIETQIVATIIWIWSKKIQNQWLLFEYGHAMC